MNTIFQQYLFHCTAVRSFSQFSNMISAYQYCKPYTQIAQFLKPGESVLDWGSGNGHLSMFLLYTQQKVTAYGFGQATPPSVLADNASLTFVAANTQEPVTLPFDDQSFHIVCSMGVLEHVHYSGGDQLASLKEIRRILQPGGLFLCFHLPYSGSWVEKILGAIMPYTKKKIFVHSRRFSRHDVIRLCEESGLTLTTWGRYNFLPRNIARKLPCSLAENHFLLALFNTVDSLLSACFPCFCNQSYFVAQKKK